MSAKEVPSDLLGKKEATMLSVMAEMHAAVALAFVSGLLAGLSLGLWMF